MVKALIASKTVPDVPSLASNRLRAGCADIFEALQAEDITPAHRFCMTEIMAHVDELVDLGFCQSRMARFDAELLRSLHDAGSEVPLRLLQTLPPNLNSRSNEIRVSKPPNLSKLAIEFSKLGSSADVAIASSSAVWMPIACSNAGTK